MFDHGRAGEEWPHDGAPLGEQRGLAEIHGVVFQRGPEYLQDVALRRLNALVDLEALEPLGLANDRLQAALDGFVKSGLLAGVDTDVCEFKNHGVSWSFWGRALALKVVDLSPDVCGKL